MTYTRYCSTCRLCEPQVCGLLAGSLQAKHAMETLGVREPTTHAVAHCLVKLHMAAGSGSALLGLEQCRRHLEYLGSCAGELSAAASGSTWELRSQLAQRFLVPVGAPVAKGAAGKVSFPKLDPAHAVSF